MAAPTSLPALLDSLTQSLAFALEATPKLAGVEPPKDGVSLLDVKNELLLSYLQNLVFLILLKIRNAKSHSDARDDDSPDLPGSVVQKLVELRLYLEKGVRPLEEKLQFQLDTHLRAADDAARRAEAAKNAKSNRKMKGADAGGSDEEGDDDDEGKEAGPGLGFAHAAAPAGMAAAAANPTGIYRPPRIAATVMPTTSRRETRERRPIKSATMDEYIEDELSTLPTAQPSIGTNVVQHGRKVKSAAEREEEEVRRNFEETNFTRLPKESKKDRAKRAKTEGHSSKMQFGGEDWHGLGEGVDRIERLTRKEKGSGGTKALLEKSRKRGRDTGDSNRGSGLNESTREIGDRFQKRLKVMEGGRRDRGKRS